MEDPNSTPAAVAYETPQPEGARQSVWAGLVLMFGALGLLVISGCFLMGVMAIYMAPAAGQSLRLQVLEVVLWILAILTFLIGLLLLLLAVGGLVRAMGKRRH